MKELLNRRKNSLHVKMELKYKKAESNVLKEQKKRLEEIRSFKAPLDHGALTEHVENYNQF